MGRDARSLKHIPTLTEVSRQGGGPRSTFNLLVVAFSLCVGSLACSAQTKSFTLSGHQFTASPLFRSTRDADSISDYVISSIEAINPRYVVIGERSHADSLSVNMKLSLLRVLLRSSKYSAVFLEAPFYLNNSFPAIKAQDDSAQHSLENDYLVKNIIKLCSETNTELHGIDVDYHDNLDFIVYRILNSDECDDLELNHLVHKGLLAFNQFHEARDPDILTRQIDSIVHDFNVLSVNKTINCKKYFDALYVLINQTYAVHYYKTIAERARIKSKYVSFVDNIEHLKFRDSVMFKNIEYLSSRSEHSKKSFIVLTSNYHALKQPLNNRGSRSKSRLRGNPLASLLCHRYGSDSIFSIAGIYSFDHLRNEEIDSFNTDDSMEKTINSLGWNSCIVWFGRFTERRKSGKFRMSPTFKFKGIKSNWRNAYDGIYWFRDMLSFGSKSQVGSTP